MSKADEDPPSINNSNIEIDINNDCQLWNTLDCDLETFIKQIIVCVLNKLNLSKQGKKIEISVLLADNERLQELNREYRNKDKPTNVLSFPNYKLKPENYISFSFDNMEI